MTDFIEFEVVSPEYEGFEDYLAGHVITAPMCAVVFVEAVTKRAAIVEACRSDEFREWVNEQRASGACPYTGVKAYPKCTCWKPDMVQGVYANYEDMVPDEHCVHCGGSGYVRPKKDQKEMNVVTD